MGYPQKKVSEVSKNRRGRAAGKVSMALALMMAFVMAITALTGTAQARHRHAKKPAKPAVSQSAQQQSQENQAKMPKRTAEPVLRIGLQQGKSSFTVMPLVDKLQLRTESSKAYPLKAAAPVEIRWQNGSFLVGKEKLKGERLQLMPAAALTDAAHFSLAGRSYRGTLEILAKKGGLTAVNLVPLDDYLLSVVPEEMPTDWPAEALKAQSVAARSFALHNRDRHATDGFDLCTTTHCQVYTGVGAEKSASTAAIHATQGEVLFYGSEPIDALFHTDSGGMTENSENVWGSFVPYLRAVKDTANGTMPWTKEVSTAAFEQKLAAKGHNVGKIRSLSLSSLKIGKAASDRTASGRVKTMTVKGTKGTAALTGNELRSLFGLKSTLFDAKLQGSKVVFSGFGFGHGLGISQWGAERLAAGGMKYDAILHHYYADVTLKKMY
ncbi:SpoIID/LytB domain-containing protein [Mitsuokella sp. WILCCON 0060]|uniref:SpoIID/LytB domain-containing protein n=1 Tax=Mitsuokella sp. WILCCON 0060 TaxID=3345341 RepID=UPI003F1B244E